MVEWEAKLLEASKADPRVGLIQPTADCNPPQHRAPSTASQERSPQETSHQLVDQHAADQESGESRMSLPRAGSVRELPGQAIDSPPESDSTPLCSAQAVSQPVLATHSLWVHEGPASAGRGRTTATIPGMSSRPQQMHAGSARLAPGQVKLEAGREGGGTRQGSTSTTTSSGMGAKSGSAAISKRATSKAAKAAAELAAQGGSSKDEGNSRSDSTDSESGNMGVTSDEENAEVDDVAFQAKGGKAAAAFRAGLAVGKSSHVMIKLEPPVAVKRARQMRRETL